MLLTLIFYFTVFAIVCPLFGKYIALVYLKPTIKGFGAIYKLESYILKPLNLDNSPQNWLTYFYNLLGFNIICLLCSFLILIFQGKTVSGVNSITILEALNLSISFVTNSFWQAGNPEENLNINGQIFALMLQNFCASGTGIAVFIACVRGVTNDKNSDIGNFFADLIKAQLFILFPIAFLSAIILMLQGVPDEYTQIIKFINLEGKQDSFFIGPAAAQSAIKLFGSNGGSIFAAGSSHPFEIPSQGSMIFQLILILLLPISLVFTYGYMIGNIKISWAIYCVIIFFICFSSISTYYFESNFGFNYFFEKANISDRFNYLGKELLQGKFISVLWNTIATMSSIGGTNSSIELYSPLSLFSLMGNLVVGRFILDSVGSGFFTMLIYITLTIFIRGLITGQTPTFLGKRILSTEIKYIIFASAIFPIGVLVFSSITIMLPWSYGLINNVGTRAVSELAYNFSSLFSNNGSSMPGLNVNSDYFNIVGSIAMLIARYPTIYCALAVSGIFAERSKIKYNNSSSGNEIEFAFFLIIMVLVTGVVSFLPILFLGPILESINFLNKG